MLNCKTCGGRGYVQAGLAGEQLERCPDCNTAPCSVCHGEGVIDSGGVTPWGAEILLPCPDCERERYTADAALGASWRKDSSLEKWFPFTAAEIADLKETRNALARELERLRAAGFSLKGIPLDEFGCYKHVAQWLQAGKYRHLIHRHNGTFTAADESENLMMQADTLPLLSDALLNWPQDAKPLHREPAAQ
jgi:hypothetical protein